MQTKRKIAAEITVSIALIILVIYIADAGVSRLNNGDGFIPLSLMERGMILGGGPIILFFISFGLGFNIKSKIITTLLIVGGALMAITVIVSTFIIPDTSNMIADSSSPSGDTMQRASSPQNLGIILIGFIIMGLGVLRALRKK
jgi:hypothetical protein